MDDHAVRRPVAVALDLEGTLISNAVSMFPRPGLHAFLEALDRVAELVVVYTAVSPARARHVVKLLAGEGSAPDWFATVPIFTSGSGIKDLTGVADLDAYDVLLVDDRDDVLPSGQQDHLVRISEFAPPYGPDDVELAATLAAIRARCIGR